MAQYITRIRTESGDLPIDYNSLANLPTTDTTLSVPGKAADANATGAAINAANNSANNAQTTANEAKTSANGAQTTANNAQTAANKANTDIAALSARVDLLSGDMSSVDLTGFVQKSGDKMTGPLETPGLIISTGEGVELWPFLAFGYYQNGELISSSMIGSMSDQHTLTIANVCVDDADKGEYYYLPVVDTGRTENGVYKILTTKEPVSIEEGGTGANNAYDALENLGVLDMISSSGEPIYTILWENASPTSSFAAQSVYISGLSNYRVVLLEYSCGAEWFPVNGSYQSMEHLRALSDTNFQTYARNLDVSVNNPDTIDFYDCYSKSTTGSTIQMENNVLIPVRVYGIRGIPA